MSINIECPHCNVLIELKACKSCSEIKNIDEFTKFKKKLSTGEIKLYPHSYCRKCANSKIKRLEKEYVKSLITATSNLESKDIPPELIETHKMLVQLKRLIKENKKCQT